MPDLYYEHLTQRQLNVAEWKQVTYVNIKTGSQAYGLAFYHSKKKLCNKLASQAVSTGRSQRSKLCLNFIDHFPLLLRPPEEMTILVLLHKYAPQKKFLLVPFQEC